MMMFGAKDMQLKQWTVTDPQGYDTTVAVYNLDTSKRPDPACSRSTTRATAIDVARVSDAPGTAPARIYVSAQRIKPWMAAPDARP